MNILFVFIGGGLGSITRYIIGLGFAKTGLNLPVSTLVSNVTACIIFALTLNLMENRPDAMQANLKLLILTGICGGLSTFSTFGYETFLLLKQQNYTWMIINILVSVVICTGSFILIKK